MSGIMLTAGSQSSEGHLDSASIGSQPTHRNLLVITTTLPSSSSRGAVRGGVVTAGLRVKSHAERFRGMSPRA